MDPIETTNDQVVAMANDEVVVMNPRIRMTVEEALRQAAWLVAITGERQRFEAIYEAVVNT